MGCVCFTGYISQLPFQHARPTQRMSFPTTSVLTHRKAAPLWLLLLPGALVLCRRASEGPGAAEAIWGRSTPH